MDTSIIQDWLKEGIELNPPASEEEIVNCENKIRFAFPNDFKLFYKVCNGFKDWIMDAKLLSLWPLEKITTEYDGSDFIPFCDYLINSSQIGFRKTESGIYRDYKYNSLICESFEQFLAHWRIESGEYI